MVQTKSYQASSTILVSVSGAATVNDAYAATQAAQQRLSSYAEIAGGRTVAQRAIDQLGVPLSAEQLMASTKVSYTPESTLFRLTVTDADPLRAASLASAMARQFAELIPTVDPGVQMSNTPAPASPTDRPTDPDPGQQPLVSAKATVVEQPTVPEYPVSPVPSRNLTLGLLAGLFVGMAIALLREATDRTVRGREKLTGSSGLPVLAELPPPGERESDGELRPNSPDDLVFEEAVRGLRNRLSGASTAQARSFLVTAPALGQGATTTALSLALSFTDVDETVLLIEGDGGQPTIAGILGVDSEQGLAEAMADGHVTDDAVATTSHPGLHVLASSGSTKVRRQFSTAAFVGTLEKLCGYFDRVVIDGPPALVAAEASSLAAAVDATLLVVRAGVTTIDDVGGSLEKLRAAGGKVVGTVLTDAAVPRRTKAATIAYYEKVGDTTASEASEAPEASDDLAAPA
jgi:capsular polysaccharide biosynthesis protein/MinD-like ATPase involved in chromosome partitioning or flagellar assembly